MEGRVVLDVNNVPTPPCQEPNDECCVYEEVPPGLEGLVRGTRIFAEIPEEWGDFITVLTALDGKRLNKRIERGPPNAGYKIEDYDLAYQFRMDVHRVEGLQDLADVLDSLDANQCVVLGKPVAGTNMDRCHRRKIDRGDLPGTLEDCAHFWTLFDLDGIEAKDARGEFDEIADPRRATDLLRSRLPPEFAGGGGWWQHTSGAGYKVDGIHMRAAFWLDGKVDCQGAKDRWGQPLLNANGQKQKGPDGKTLKVYPLDSSLYSAEHAIYVAAPTLGEGVPVKVATRSMVLLGPVVQLPAFTAPPKPQAPSRPPRAPGAPYEAGDADYGPITFARLYDDLSWINPNTSREERFPVITAIGAAYVVEPDQTSEEIEEGKLHAAQMFNACQLYREQPCEIPKGSEHRGEEDVAHDFETVGNYGTIVNRVKEARGEPRTPEEKYGDPSKFAQAQTTPTDITGNPAKADDDGGPIIVNSRNLDNQHVPGEWITYAEAIDDDEEEAAEEVIPLWAEKHILTLDEGPGGVGKSYINQQDAACIAAGHPVLGEAVEQTDVLYLNYEEPEDEFKRRMSRVRQRFGVLVAPDGRTQEEWETAHPPGYGLPKWQSKDGVWRPLDTSRFSARHLRGQGGAHILRVTKEGEIIVTRFGRKFFALLAERREQERHSMVYFDGLMDAILFEGGTRMDDGIVRQVIELLDRWCIEYGFTARGILHPSRAAERGGGGSYAPAWSTKPRALQTYKRVTWGGQSVNDQTQAEHIFTRRRVEKRSHGQPGHYVDLQYQTGVWMPLWRAGGYSTGGGETAGTVAVAIAIRQDDAGQRIKKDGTIGTQSDALGTKHVLVIEYQQRTGAKHGKEHFLGELGSAVKEGRLAYQEGGRHDPAGYKRP